MRMKKRKSTTEIIRRLRQPAAATQMQTSQTGQEEPVVSQAKKRKEKKVLGGLVYKKDLPLVVIGVVCFSLVFITLIVFLTAKNKAEDLRIALDPAQLEGLKVETNEFKPNTGVTYIQVQEGQDRNVTNLSNAGTSLPIISRFNLKTFTPSSYKIIGAAPWAITSNFAANINDPVLMRKLLDNEDMIQAFLARADVAPLLEDPQLLIAFAKDEKELADFFGEDTVQQILTNEQMLRNFAGSRFMGHLLISPSGKYLRAHPQEALAVINASPTLSALRSNPGVRKAVGENPKLGPLASTLLAVPGASKKK